MCWLSFGRRYFHEQSTRPNTVGTALFASPVSLCAWVRRVVGRRAALRCAACWTCRVCLFTPVFRIVVCPQHLEKFQEWSDVGNNIFDAYTEDDLITHIMVYWVTDAMYTSVRLYHESMTSANFWAASRSAILVPTAYADFPAEAARASPIHPHTSLVWCHVPCMPIVRSVRAFTLPMHDWRHTTHRHTRNVSALRGTEPDAVYTHDAWWPLCGGGGTKSTGG